MKLVQDNPSSMYQVCQELLTNHHRPIFIIIERANLLFRKLPDSAIIICQHYKYLTGSKLSLIFESREPLHALNFPTSSSVPVVFNLPEYTKQEVEDILIKEKPADCSSTLYHNYLQTVIGYFYLSTHDLRLLKHVLTAHFDAYCQPVREGAVSESSVVLLWRKIEPVFRVARASLFLKSEGKENETTLGTNPPRNPSCLLTSFVFRAAVLLKVSSHWRLSSLVQPLQDRQAIFFKKRRKDQKTGRSTWPAG